MSNPSTLADVVPGNFSDVSTHYSNVTLGQMLYNDPQTVHLEGGKSQAAAWSIRADNKTHVSFMRPNKLLVSEK